MVPQTTRTLPSLDRAAVEAAIREAVQRLSVRAYLMSDLVPDESDAPSTRDLPVSGTSPPTPGP